MNAHGRNEGGRIRRGDSTAGGSTAVADPQSRWRQAARIFARGAMRATRNTESSAQDTDSQNTHAKASTHAPRDRRRRIRRPPMGEHSVLNE